MLILIMIIIMIKSTPVDGGPPELTAGWPGRLSRQDVACGRRRRQHWLAASAPGCGAHGVGGHRGLRGN